MLEAETSEGTPTVGNIAALFEVKEKTARTGLAMQYVDSLGTLNDNHIRQIICELRLLLISNITSSSASEILETLKSLTLLYPFCQNNNVNKRMVLETVLLGKTGDLTNP